MRLSKYLLPTTKELPSDAVVRSHQLMLKAGLIRQLTAGVYNYLPLGWRVLRKIEQIVREEQDRIGGQELLMPVIHPQELWEQTGRSEALDQILFRLVDKKGRKLVLSPTHEETISEIGAAYIQSYRDLSQIWYHIQLKFRDEPRPRSGVLRARQFIMKDAYSFDADNEALDYSYKQERVAYSRTFARCGIDTFIVGASSGAMGGKDSEEFMCFSDAGEDRCVVCTKCAYKANMEVAKGGISKLEPLGLPEQDVETPNKKTIEEVSTFLGIPSERLMKVVIYVVADKPVMVLIRGDQEVLEEKFTARFGDLWRPAEPAEILDMAGAEAGFIGPVGLKRRDVLIVADESLQPGVDYYSGANRNHYHRSGIVIGKNVHPAETLNLREVKEGEACIECGAPLKIEKAIELGHIFKLGMKYADALGINYLDPAGNEKKVTMGCYGIGVERIMAAAIETHSDNYGISWPVTIAPFYAIVIPLDPRDKALSEAAEKCYNDLWDQCIEALIDDRDQSAGFKFNDADLIGIPVQIIFGLKSFKNGEAEIKIRATGERKKLPIDKIVPEVAKILDEMRREIDGKVGIIR